MPQSLLALLTTLLAACSNVTPPVESPVFTMDTAQFQKTITSELEDTIDLGHDFQIKVGRKEVFGDFETYTLFILSRKDKQLFLDTSNTEYEFRDTLYPMLRQVDEETFEVLAEVNNRPNRNYLMYWMVQRDSVVKADTLPTFFTEAYNHDSDERLEFAGIWDHSEFHSWTTYNPIMYYELTKSGIVLDSNLTIRIIKEIFGHFYGYKYNENLEIDRSRREIWSDAIDRIMKRK
jgi:hypothetical protein